MQAVRHRGSHIHLKWVAPCDRGGVLLDRAEQDHRHHFVERLFHQNGSLHGSQTAFDAMPLDRDLWGHVLKLAAQIAEKRQYWYPEEHECEETEKGDRCTTAGEGSDCFSEVKCGLRNNSSCGNVCLGEGCAKRVLPGPGRIGACPGVGDTAIRVESRLRLGGEARWRTVPARLLRLNPGR